MNLSTTVFGWQYSNISSQWLFIYIFFTVVVAFVVHQKLFAEITAYKKSSKHGKHKSGNKSETNRESRLLHKQFGVIDDDLALQVSFRNHNHCDDVHDMPIRDRCKLATVSDSNQTKDIARLPADSIISEKIKNVCKSNVTNNAQSPDLRRTRSQLSRMKQYKRQRFANAAEIRQAQRPHSFLRSSNDHPGLSAFWHWCDTEMSLFRVYTITRKDGILDESTTPPYNPSSRRGKVPIKIHVTNNMDITVIVYWINYKGAPINKGFILSNGGTWTQNTWIDHPWIFCGTKNGSSTEEILLHYIPYKVIPTLEEAPTTEIDPDSTNGVVGIHRFQIFNAPNDSVQHCRIVDPILPHTAELHLPTSWKAAEFAIRHCLRMNYVGWSVLQKYISKIVDHHDKKQFRQIRTSNQIFSNSVWNTPAKGILLAVGFVENFECVEFGSEDALSSDMVQELSLLLHIIQIRKDQATSLNGNLKK